MMELNCVLTMKVEWKQLMFITFEWADSYDSKVQ